MPRPNPARTISSEQALARRLAYERDRREMSYEGLALRMEKVGCPIQASGLYKIEKAGRRITVDELVGLARVFELDVSELLQPVEMVLHADITKAEETERKAWSSMHDAVEAVVEARRARAALYRRAMSEIDSELGKAVDAYWAEQLAASAAAAAAAKPGGLAKKVAQFEQERESTLAAMTSEERAEWETARELEFQLEEALGALADAIYRAGDPHDVLGDS